MTIKVESCWSGGDKYAFRLTLPNGEREHIGGDKWTRFHASQALDLLESVYGLNRKNIRFRHH
jgi:hypothetical protein